MMRYKYTLWDRCGEFVTLIAGVALWLTFVLGGIAVGIDFVTQYQCSKHGEVTNKEVRYVRFVGCYVVHSETNQYVPFEPNR